MGKILLIEDDAAIRMGLKYIFEHEGYLFVESKDGINGLNEFSNNKDIDLILLDINLPDINGFELFSKLKSIRDIPIIFLTANDLEASVVMGLDMGADDYVVKPFKTQELLSRVKKALKKNGISNNIINIGDVIIDIKQAKVFKNNVDIFLTALEYKILLILALSPNVVFTREKILGNIWDVNEAFVNDNTLTVYVKRIREKIENDPKNPKIILTVRGIGYRFGDNDDKK